MKKVLVISSSLRKGSNSEELARKFYEGAKYQGNETEFITLKDKKMNFCIGCLKCIKLHKCIINDDLNEIINKIKEADVICFTTPIYYYEMSGQLKTLLDRCNPLYSQDYSFRDIYFIACSQDDNKESMDKAINGLQGFIDCFEKSSLKGVLKATGVDAPLEINDHEEYLEEAFNLGKNIK